MVKAGAAPGANPRAVFSVLPDTGCGKIRVSKGLAWAKIGVFPESMKYNMK